MEVKNMQSAKGNTIPNQFIIRDNEGRRYFQSYGSIIVVMFCGKVKLDLNFWDYSNTTRKYRNIFLGEDSKKIKAKIKSGEYILTNLN